MRLASSDNQGIPSTITTHPPTEPAKRKHSRRIVVNDTSYTVLKRLGKGGSGSVYVVLGAHNSLWAFKSIRLQHLDEHAKKMIENEVALLQSLEKVGRVVRLENWAINEARKQLHMVMELGQCDLDAVVRDQLDQNPRLDLVFTGFYWREMLKCVAAVHRLDIVHSDLKPANFVLVKGSLKLVDFGVANAIPDNTINVYKEQLAGTPNYMAPETLRAMASGTHTDQSRLYRFGKPSDVWSLGCILYQMIYGSQPFKHIQGLGPKLMAISDPDHIIDFPKRGLGDVEVPALYMGTMMACLNRDPTARPTVHALLDSPNGHLDTPTLPSNDGGGVTYVSQKSLELALSEAVRQAGLSTSPSDYKGWASDIMQVLEQK